MDINQLATRQLELRALRATLKAEFEARDKVFTDEMDAIEQQFIAACEAANVKSMRTDAGTVIFQETKRFWTSDWEATYKFIREHNAFELLEKRIAQSNLREFLESNPGVVPPGLNYTVEKKATVRSAK